MSTIVPNMSTDSCNLTLLECLFGKTRRSILTLLYGQPDESFYLRKILKLAGVSSGAGQRELKRLSDAGIITRSLWDGRVHFQANSGCPIYIELKSLFVGIYYS